MDASPATGADRAADDQRCRRRLLRHDEVPEQPASGHRLHRPRVDREQVIAEDALLVVPNPVGFENVPPARGARHHQRHARRV